MSAGAVATPLSGLRVAVTGEFTQTREQLQASNACVPTKGKDGQFDRNARQTTDHSRR